MNWEVVCQFLNLPIPPDNIKFPSCDMVIGTRQLMSIDIVSSSEEDNFESMPNDLDETNALEDVHSLENNQMERKFETMQNQISYNCTCNCVDCHDEGNCDIQCNEYRNISIDTPDLTDNNFKPQNESTPLFLKEDDTESEKEDGEEEEEEEERRMRRRSTKQLDSPIQQDVDKMEFWSMDFSGDNKIMNEITTESINGVKEVIEEGVGSDLLIDQYECQTDFSEDTASIANAGTSEKIDIGPAIEIANDKNDSLSDENGEEEKEIIVINRVQREIRIDEEPIPSQNKIEAQSLLLNNKIADEQQNIIQPGIKNDKANIVEENGLGLQPSNSNVQDSDVMSDTMSQGNQHIPMKVEDPKESPRLPIIDGIEIVEVVENEEQGNGSGVNLSENNASNISPSPYKKKSLLDAPDHSRRRSRSRKRSRSRHNVVYHFGMA